MLQNGEPFFERHGPKAVFFGRFVLGLRVWASWLAGATHMHWRSFVLWNALGGICWATAIGLLAYFLGHAAGNAIETFGIYGLVGGGDRCRRRPRRPPPPLRRLRRASSAAGGAAAVGAVSRRRQGAERPSQPP